MPTPAADAEGFPVGQAGVNLGVSRGGENAVTFQPDHRAGLAKLVVKGVGVREEIVAERVDARDRRAAGSLSC